MGFPFVPTSHTQDFRTNLQDVTPGLEVGSLLSQMPGGTEDPMPAVRTLVVKIKRRAGGLEVMFSQPLPHPSFHAVKSEILAPCKVTKEVKVANEFLCLSARGNCPRF